MTLINHLVNMTTQIIKTLIGDNIIVNENGDIDAVIMDTILTYLNEKQDRSISVKTGQTNGVNAPVVVQDIPNEVKGDFHVALCKIDSLSELQIWTWNSVSWLKWHVIPYNGGGGGGSASPQMLVDSVKLNYLHGRTHNVDAHDGNDTWIKTVQMKNIIPVVTPYAEDTIDVRVHLLKIFISNWDDIAAYNPIIFFDRYKRKYKNKEKHFDAPVDGTPSYTWRTTESKFMKATPDLGIQLTGKSQLIDFNPQAYFNSSTYGFPVRSGVGIKSFSGQHWRLNEAEIEDEVNNPNAYHGGVYQGHSVMYYRPRIQIEVNGTLYESSINQTLKVKAIKYSDLITSEFKGTVGYTFT